MKPHQPEPIDLGGHCCVCTTERGGMCGHIGEPKICKRHLEPMASNPMITPDNPMGHWVMPFEKFDGAVDIEFDKALVVDSCSLMAASMDTPMGRLPAVVLQFGTSALPLEDQPPPFVFISSADTLRAFAALAAQSAEAAVEATVQGGN